MSSNSVRSKIDKINQILDEIAAELSKSEPKAAAVKSQENAVGGLGSREERSKESKDGPIQSGESSSGDEKVSADEQRDRQDRVRDHQAQDQPKLEGQNAAQSAETTEQESPEGKIGVFDGESVIIDDKKYQVPPNYISKSKFVVGDRLKLLKIGDYNEFKMVAEVPRVKLDGILTKKNNQWVVLANNYDFRVISAAIRYFGGEIGDRVEILLPQGYENKPPEWAAVEKVEKLSEAVKPPVVETGQKSHPGLDGEIKTSGILQQDSSSSSKKEGVPGKSSDSTGVLKGEINLEVPAQNLASKKVDHKSQAGQSNEPEKQSQDLEGVILDDIPELR